MTKASIRRALLDYHEKFDDHSRRHFAAKVSPVMFAKNLCLILAPLCFCIVFTRSRPSPGQKKMRQSATPASKPTVRPATSTWRYLNSLIR
jgi:hypothetical protein